MLSLKQPVVCYIIKVKRLSGNGGISFCEVAKLSIVRPTDFAIKNSLLFG